MPAILIPEIVEKPEFRSEIAGERNSPYTILFSTDCGMIILYLHKK